MDEPLTPELLVQAYRQGFFPMGEEDGSISWYWPDPRTIIPLDGFHVSRRLAQTVRQQRFEIVIDHDFEGVIRGCAAREETWITEQIVAAYTALYHRGLAHSIEAYKEGRLVGGIYGVSLGGAFMGESMFSHATDASKVCLVHLVERLRAQGYSLFDVQFTTGHLKRFGAMEIPRKEYLRRLGKAIMEKRRFVD
jgi:leucyl/phenylalanyl-tRNA--protein transferase